MTWLVFVVSSLLSHSNWPSLDTMPSSEPVRLHAYRSMRRCCSAAAAVATVTGGAVWRLRIAPGSGPSQMAPSQARGAVSDSERFLSARGPGKRRGARRKARLSSWPGVPWPTRACSGSEPEEAQADSNPLLGLRTLGSLTRSVRVIPGWVNFRPSKILMNFRVKFKII